MKYSYGRQSDRVFLFASFPGARAHAAGKVFKVSPSFECAPRAKCKTQIGWH